MASNRIGRINEEIQRELASLPRTVKDPRVHGLVSITHVETHPGPAVRQGLCKRPGPERRQGGHPGAEVRRGVSSPGAGPGPLPCGTPSELVFQADDSIEKGSHILKLLHDVEGQGGQA